MAPTDGIKNKLTAIADAIRGKTNKTEELTLEQMASEVSDIYSPKAEEMRRINIDENGTVIVSPSEGSDVMKEVEVTTRIFGTGYDLNSIGFDSTSTNKFNQRYKDGFDYAKGIIDSWDEKTTQTQLFSHNKNLIFFPNINLENLINFNYDNALYYSNVEAIASTLYIPKARTTTGALAATHFLRGEVEILAEISTSAEHMFTEAFCVESVKIHAPKATTYYAAFYYCFLLEYVQLSDISNVTNTTQMFVNCISLKYAYLAKWKQTNISLGYSSALSQESIKYIIWHALNGENQGATSRILYLPATPYNSWDTWKLTKPSVEDCDFLGIDETEITKYGELTWEDIALHVKLITIAK